MGFCTWKGIVVTPFLLLSNTHREHKVKTKIADMTITFLWLIKIPLSQFSINCKKIKITGNQPAVYSKPDSNKLLFFFKSWCFYLFIWLRWVLAAARGLLSSCGVQAPGCVGSVVCGTQALQLRRSSSVVVACRLSCPAASGILVPQPGIKPTSSALEGRFFTTGPPGKSQ